MDGVVPLPGAPGLPVPGLATPTCQGDLSGRSAWERSPKSVEDEGGSRSIGIRSILVPIRVGTESVPPLRHPTDSRRTGAKTPLTTNGALTPEPPLTTNGALTPEPPGASQTHEDATGLTIAKSRLANAAQEVQDNAA